jgi:hypothetical protein
MADKHDELALGMGKQCILTASDVLVDRPGYYIYAITDTVLASVTVNSESAGTGETITGSINGKTIPAGVAIALNFSALTVTSGDCIAYLRK